MPTYIIKVIKHLLHGRSITYELPSQNIEFQLTGGTPQGSPLSPIFWNIIVAKILNTNAVWNKNPGFRR